LDELLVNEEFVIISELTGDFAGYSVPVGK
jgi:hypothetical protein